MARQLVKWDYLPRPDTRLVVRGAGATSFSTMKYNVRFRRRLIVDLGGIAKALRLIALLQR